MMKPLVYVLAFVAVVMMVQSVATMVFSSGDRSRRLNRRLDLLGSGMARDKVFETLVRVKPGGTLATAAPALYERMALYFRQAGMAMSPQRFAAILIVVAVILCGVAAFGMSLLSRGQLAANFLVSMLGAAGLALTGGFFWISMLRSRRLKKLEEQLPLALDVTVRAIRAGHPLVAAVKLASDEMGDPIGSEFGLIVDETSYGLEFRSALVNFAHRTGSEYAHFFAVSVAIQSETGGNLAEILGNLCTVIRNKLTLHLRVRALAAEGRMSATILSALPVILISFLMLTQPDFYTSKFDDPIFWPVVGIVMVFYFIGQFIIHKMVNFKY